MSGNEEARPRALAGVAAIVITALVASGATYVLTAADRSRRVAPADPAPDATGAIGRGRGARDPGDIPARGWRDILKRTFLAFTSDHITVIAGGVTFSVLLAIFPALAAFVGLYGLVANVDDIPGQLHTLGAVLPSDTVKFLGGEMTRLAHANHGGLSLALVFGVLLSFWSANGAMKSLFVGMNVAYDQTERRGLITLNLTTLAFTLGLVVFFALSMTVLAADAVVARFVGPGPGRVVAFARWPLLLIGFGGGLTLLYRYGPSREHARWRWVSWGSAAATVLWLAASLLFSFYTSRFSHYDRTYGSLGAVVGLMIWIWLSAIIVLLGAELNGEIERQVGNPAPAA
jgi:membrane protein